MELGGIRNWDCSRYVELLVCIVSNVTEEVWGWDGPALTDLICEGFSFETEHHQLCSAAWLTAKAGAASSGLCTDSFGNPHSLPLAQTFPVAFKSFNFKLKVFVSSDFSKLCWVEFPL